MSRAERILSLASVSTPEKVESDAQILDVLRAHKKELLGKSALDEVEVVQWLALSAAPFNEAAFKKIDAMLALKTYLVGQRVTLADIAVFSQIADHFAPSESSPHLGRWAKHLARILPGNSALALGAEPVVTVPLPVAVEAKEEQAAKKTKTEEAKDSKESKEEKDGKEEKAKEGKAKEAKTKEGKAEKESEKSEAPADDLDPSKLDIRVGLIVKCWNHPDSEKLLCEEIDLGEGAHRMIASGIRLHYTAESIQGRKIMVLANLKERSIAGFKSQGMVLCASNADHSEVKLLEPPANANVGDRVVFTGFAGEPATAAQVAKKKIFESLAPFLRTDAQGVAHWKNASFTIGGEPCKAPLVNATVS